MAEEIIKPTLQQPPEENIDYKKLLASFTRTSAALAGNTEPDTTWMSSLTQLEAQHLLESLQICTNAITGNRINGINTLRQPIISQDLKDSSQTKQQ